MADDKSTPEGDAALKTVFRRSSIAFGFIKASAMLNILKSMGQSHVDEAELNKWIANLDPNNTGTLGFEEYNSIVKHFVKDPTAIERAASDDYSFKHLIGLPDFAHA